MNLLNPAAAWWLLLVPALIALYMLRPRSRRKPVPSLRLWRELPQVERPTPRLRRPPLSWLLLLQALLLAAGAFALMQPALWTPAARHTVVLLDMSGSMQTVEGASTRFEQARTEARNVAGKLRDTDRITLLGVGPTVLTACSNCIRNDFERALGELTPSAGRANWPAALSIASGLAGQAEANATTTYVISDGAFADLPDAGLPSDMHFVQVGDNVTNLAVSVLSARRPPNNSPGYSAYARIENVSTSQANVQVSAVADTVPLPPRSLSIPAGGHADVTWDVPAGALKLTVGVDTQDALAADNQAVLFLPTNSQNQVIVKSDDPAMYMRAVAGYHGLQPITDTVKSSAETAFTVWEGELPSALPAGGLFLVNPSGSLLNSTGDMENLGSLDVVAGHPLLRDIDLRALFVERARKYEAPAWLEPIVQSADGPLLLAGEQDGRRIAVLAFDPRESNLPKLAAFPLLMANLADWLYPQSGVGALRPGEVAIVPPGATVTTPSGRAVQATEAGVFVDTHEVGIYTVSAANGQANPQDAASSFAVNMADINESNVTPRDHPELERAAVEVSERVATQDYWSPLAALALVLAGGEWLLYCLKRGRM
ncbi:MAG: BatA and WFA domain-containing protein [Chloroflexota bacterium]|nr:BatA and WFA domain-containing protein [Chloroflexota bacterium]MDQ5867168.1 BatA and WFA domain-containing protein [Chloroflexota bacterium]